MTITFNNNNMSQIFGKVRYPCTCCNEKFTIYDINENEVFWIIGSVCQCGILCGKWGRCYETVFNIIRPENPDEVCGKIVKIAKCSSCITNADTFNVFYPKDATPQQKMLIISATLMMDYQFFENENE